MKMFALYNLAKDLIRKESYFEVSSILEDLFQISFVHKPLEYQLNNITIFHRFFHDHVKEEGKYYTRYEYLNELHRLDGPARIHYDEHGNILYKEYLLNGELHREDGPAIIEYDNNGNVTHVIYYLHGVMC